MGSAPSPVTSHRIFGVPVLSCGPDLACDLIEARLADRMPTRVAFLNANLSLLSIERPDLKQALTDFVVFNDGVGIEIANRLLNGSAFPANLNGTDFIPYLLSRAHKPIRMFLLGAKQETLRKAVQTFRQRWPHHTVVGFADGYFSAEQEPSILKSIADATPDIVLVAMGNPRQELWIAQNIPHCAPCALGVGALFDFIAGDARRAPRWVRTLRFEWLFRLTLEPRRLWQRYFIGGARFLAYVIAVWAKPRAAPIATPFGAPDAVADRAGLQGGGLPRLKSPDVQAKIPEEGTGSRKRIPLQQ